MKALKLLAVLLLVGVHFLNAQPSTFLKMYNKGNSGFAVREVPGNNYAVAGGTDYYNNYHWFLMSPIATTNMHLFETNSFGNLLWEKIFSLPGSRINATWMEPTSDNGLIITGQINHDTNWPPDSNDVALVKTDNAGTILWAKKFDTGKDELAYCVQQTMDGGYVISCFHDALPVSLVGTTYAMLIKTDSNGNIQWEKKYQLPVRDLDTGEAMPVIVKQVSDGGYILISTTAASHAADICLIRTNTNGDAIWAKSYEQDASVFRFSVGLDVIETLSGNFIIAAAMDKNRTLNQLNYPFVMKISGNGNLISSKIYTSVPDQMFQSGFSSIEQTSDGGYFFTGMGGYGGFGDQAQLLKTDSSLNMEWSRVYTMDGLATMGSRSGRSTSDGCYIFTGKRQFSGSVLMKTNNVGMIPCKTPTVLTEIIPTLIVSNYTPTVNSGINSSNLILNTQLSLIDTTTLCPVLILTLPIQLVEFSAKAIADNKVMLNWSTSSETNNEGFEIQKSDDGKMFRKIGFVAGAGNSSQLNNYTFLDDFSNKNAIVYYRLNQFDRNGASVPSKIIAVNFSAPNFTPSLKVFTSFETHSIDLFFDKGESTTWSITISDLSGRQVLRERFEVSQSETRITISDVNLPHGVYFYSAENGESVLNGKIFY